MSFSKIAESFANSAVGGSPSCRVPALDLQVLFSAVRDGEPVMTTLGPAKSGLDGTVKIVGRTPPPRDREKPKALWIVRSLSGNEEITYRGRQNAIYAQWELS